MVTVIRPSRARCVRATIPRHERAVLPFKEGRMLVASTSVFGFHCTTPAASPSRTPPSRPRASARPVIVHVFAHRLHLVSNERSLWRLMQASLDFHRCVAKSAGQRMETVECGFMELQNRSKPQLEWPLAVFHMSGDDLDRE